LHDSVFVEILAKTLNHYVILVGTIKSVMKSMRLIIHQIVAFH
ncbi:hypothetical protein T11_4875, partial [Trichinella zimbabwensis]